MASLLPCRRHRGKSSYHEKLLLSLLTGAQMTCYQLQIYCVNPQSSQPPVVRRLHCRLTAEVCRLEWQDLQRSHELLLVSSGVLSMCLYRCHRPPGVKTARQQQTAMCRVQHALGGHAGEALETPSSHQAERSMRRAQGALASAQISKYCTGCQKGVSSLIAAALADSHAAIERHWPSCIVHTLRTACASTSCRSSPQSD